MHPQTLFCQKFYDFTKFWAIYSRMSTGESSDMKGSDSFGKIYNCWINYFSVYAYPNYCNLCCISFHLFASFQWEKQYLESLSFWSNFTCSANLSATNRFTSSFWDYLTWGFSTNSILDLQAYALKFKSSSTKNEF